MAPTDHRGMRRGLGLIILAAMILSETLQPGAIEANTGNIPLIDMGSQTYLGFSGGLYENGTNAVPADHASAGAARAASVQALDTSGNPSPSGKIVLLSIGMSNTTQEFCSANSELPCNSWTFMGQAAVDSRVNHAALALVNGARGGQAAATWDASTDTNYDFVRDNRLTPQALSEQQVQAVWLKVANPGPTMSLPSSSSDSYMLETQMGNIVRALRVRYPNIKLVFVSSRIYAGNATTTLNPEPYAYESGFAVKWLVQAQIAQMRNGGAIVDTRAGNLNYNTGAPWIAWGPYLWADGTTPRSDGLTWQASDFVADGTHPAMTGQQKVGSMLLEFFTTSPYTVPWFCVSSACSASVVGGIAELTRVPLHREGSSGSAVAMALVAVLAAVALAAGAMTWRGLMQR